MTRRRIIELAGRTLTRDEILRFEVVRGVLLGELTLEHGARTLAMPVTELARLVTGARAAVIRTLGAAALEEARQPYELAV